jgi:death-on-curing protein
VNPEYLTLEDLPALADDLGVPKVRDLGLLDSAAHRLRCSLMGRDA